MRNLTLTTKIFIALIFGIISGIVANIFFGQGTFVTDFLINGVCQVVGQVFLNAIKMLVVPLVFVSITVGTAQMGDIKKLGRIGSKTLLFYLLTTSVAIIIGLTFANIVDPGVGLDLSNVVYAAQDPVEKVSVTDTLINIVPSNIFSAMATANMLQIIFFSVFLGIALTTLGEKTKTIQNFFAEFNDVLLKMLTMLMEVAPYAVFSLLIVTFSDLGYSAIMPVFKYVFAAITAMGIHVIVVYMTILALIGRLRPVQFIKNIFSAMQLAFSTASSSGTLPVSLECAEQNCGVDSEVASFVLPLGATINMDGTAIMQGTAVVFIAQAYGIDLTMMDYASVILTATLASIGTAGVPGSGVIMLSMVITQIGLPIEAVGIVMGVDRLVDMARTSINITGDILCSTIVAKSEGMLDIEVFNSKPKI